MNSAKLFLVVFLAVTAANVLTLALLQLWATHQSARLLSDLQAITAQRQAELQETARRLSEQAQEASRRASEQAQTAQRRAQTEAERRQNAARIESETCAHWRRFYAKEKTEYNRLMMDRACTRGTP